MWTALAVPAAAQTIVQVTDDIGQDAVWASDNTYVLNGFVFVDDGAALTIEPGTVVRGKPGQAENASALIVAQGGKIFAAGTREEPIIFTAEADDVSDPFDLILGKAVINTSTGVGSIEGIPTTEPRGAYGGTDGDDAFDIDEGWRGDNQFWCAVQAEEIGDRAGEHEAAPIPRTASPTPLRGSGTPPSSASSGSWFRVTSPAPIPPSSSRRAACRPRCPRPTSSATAPTPSTRARRSATRCPWTAR